MEKQKEMHILRTNRLAAFIFYHIFIIAGFKPSAQKAEECLQKVRALQKEGWWQLVCVSVFVCGALKVRLHCR